MEILRKLDRAWKPLVLVGAIMGAGFAASNYAHRFQEVEKAKAAHAALAEKAEEEAAAVDAKVATQKKELEGILIRNVRIELGQIAINKQLERQRLVDKAKAEKWSERRETLDQIEKIDDEIDTIGEAVTRSYQRTPVIPDHGLPKGDPLAGLDGI